MGRLMGLLYGGLVLCLVLSVALLFWAQQQKRPGTRASMGEMPPNRRAGSCHLDRISDIVSSHPKRLSCRNKVKYFEFRGPLVERDMKAAVAKLLPSAMAGRRMVDECHVLWSIWVDYPHGWLGALRPSTEGDVAQAADVYFALRWLFPACSIDLVDLKRDMSAAVVASHYSLFLTGYLGISMFDRHPGTVEGLAEKTYLIDEYGTSREFIEAGDAPYCCSHLPLDHILSYHPDGAGNTFLGSVFVPPPLCGGGGLKRSNTTRPYGVVHGKCASCCHGFLRFSFSLIPSAMQQITPSFLEAIAKHIPLKLTVRGNAGPLPSGVENVGLLPADKYTELVRDASLFVVAGPHIFGPAAISAVQCGTALLQPRFSRAYRKDVVEKLHYRGKPTTVIPWSPWPMLEKYESHVYTVDFDKRDAVGEAVGTILKRAPTLQPLVIQEATAEGFVERVLRIALPHVTVLRDNK